ncbi:hypothetical protein [Sphingobacterium corticibacter]|uniref:Carboxypeptidase-like regulatory domain-containing protein n=1 Tax=Sphingobacterium corticibacter TaxID=2171749 RepID=A0A2T8HFX5_9SPHI|nr:hypothetical protein [Sphingobacterium corticibacter]PVH24314.1 hypothetical protein DC487_14615 [Sphingobacterium corticibacter]
MMIRLFSILLTYILFLGDNSYAQIQFIDSLSGQPIAAMNVFNLDGMLIGTTTVNGHVGLLTTNSFEKNFSNYVVTDHIAYKPVRIFVDDFENTQVYKVIPMTKNISEVVIQRPSLSKDDVIKLSCYYRSFDNYDQNNRYYFDGIIDCYIPLSGTAPKYELIDYRIFLNDSVHHDFKKVTGNFLSFSFLPEISIENLGTRLSKLDVDDGASYRYIRKEDAIVGHLKEQTDNIELYLDKVKPDSVLRSKLFGFELQIFEEKVYEVYGIKQQLEAINVYDLERISETLISKIKRGKMELMPYEVSTQLYVLNRKMITQKEYKTFQKKLFKNIRRLPETSDFKNKYWENFAMQGIPEVPQQLQLDSKMELLFQ